MSQHSGERWELQSPPLTWAWMRHGCLWVGAWGGVPAGCARGVAEHGSPHRALAAWAAQGRAQSGCRGGLGAMGELGTSTQVSRMGVVEGGGLIA